MVKVAVTNDNDILYNSLSNAFLQNELNISTTCNKATDSRIGWRKKWLPFSISWPIIYSHLYRMDEGIFKEEKVFQFTNKKRAKTLV